MKSIKRIFFLLSFISVSYLSTFAQENQSYFLHTIEKGQSLYSSQNQTTALPLFFLAALSRIKPDA